MNARTQADFDGLHAAGRAVRAAFDAMQAAVVPGLSTLELDEIGAAVLTEHGARSAPQLYYDFPGATCISVNEQAAHGIPGDLVLKEGDLINIDVSANKAGYVADMGQSFTVGAASPERQRICTKVREAVHAALDQVRAGRSLNVIGKAVQAIADREGYNIVRNLGSHGVGRNIHEEPSYVPFHNPRERRRLQKGMVLTIEPFFSTGTDWVYEEDDGWTLSVQPGDLVAQYEHTLIVTDGAPIVVTA
ncbi:MAG: type I methionyl aminopeptidase [Pseudomonadota bacterium]